MTHEEEVAAAVADLTAKLLAAHVVVALGKIRKYEHELAVLLNGSTRPAVLKYVRELGIREEVLNGYMGEPLPIGMVQKIDKLLEEVNSWALSARFKVRALAVSEGVSGKA